MQYKRTCTSRIYRPNVLNAHKQIDYNPLQEAILPINILMLQIFVIFYLSTNTAFKLCLFSFWCRCSKLIVRVLWYWSLAQYLYSGKLHQINYYRAMHVVLARYCYRRTSVRPSVCLSVCPSITLRYAEHIGWTSSKLITQIISLGSSLLGATTSAI